MFVVFNIYIAIITGVITISLLLIERSEPGFFRGVINLINQLCNILIEMRNDLEQIEGADFNEALKILSE